MPRYIEIDDDDDDLEFHTPGDPAQDSALVKQLRKELKKAQQAAKDAEDRAGKAESKVRSRTVADVLKEKGAPPALSRYALRDLEEAGTDPSPEAVAVWLAENGSLFGYKPQTPDVAQVLGLPAGTELPPDLVATYQRFLETQGTGHADPIDAILAKVQGAGTKDELLALIASTQ